MFIKMVHLWQRGANGDEDDHRVEIQRGHPKYDGMNPFVVILQIEYSLVLCMGKLLAN